METKTNTNQSHQIQQDYLSMTGGEIAMYYQMTDCSVY